jgi:tetratricopeptide (TPR) repeat protein
MFQACAQDADYAPFYLTRTNLVNDPKQVLADLQTANKMAPEEWRTWNYLINHFENTGDFKKQLTVASQAFKKFKGDYTLGFGYARALLNNGQYDASISVLKKLHILPFEGSSDGRDIYEQATLLSALELIKGKKYKNALAKIEESRQWPENLGVGEPYNVDNRIQDYLTAYCLDKLGRSSEINKLHDKVFEYTNENFDRASVNNILPFIIYEHTGNKEKTGILLDKLKTSPTATRPLQRWVIAAAEKNKSTLNALSSELRENKYVDIMQRILSL